LALTIHDIEPTYTVGELAIQKQKIIDRLTEEGVIQMNRELIMPELCQKIAVISSETAAGYGDFIDQLEHNAYQYKFYIKLFRATMQGSAAEASIIRALDRVYQHETFFDVVVIIRGGGSQADLSCFNSYWLASHVAQFPLPVLTGIGHEQDDSVTDLVAHQRLKTPTAVAAFLIEHMAEDEHELDETTRAILQTCSGILAAEEERLQRALRSFERGVTEALHVHRYELQALKTLLSSCLQHRLGREYQQIDHQKTRLTFHAKRTIGDQYARLKNFRQIFKRILAHTLSDTQRSLKNAEETLRMLNPEEVLKRGYSVTRVDGKAITDTVNLKPGENLETTFYKGKTLSTIKKVNHGRKKDKL
jgi:exodeoxyribonuclease VII large subunit